MPWSRYGKILDYDLPRQCALKTQILPEPIT